jgi:hypothetical protein
VVVHHAGSATDHEGETRPEGDLKHDHDSGDSTPEVQPGLLPALAIATLSAGSSVENASTTWCERTHPAAGVRGRAEERIVAHDAGASPCGHP